jgi:flagellar motor switch protein FliN
MELSPEFTEQLLAACKAGAAEAAGALGRALGGEYSLEIRETAAFDLVSPPDGFDGAGLAVLLQAGDIGFVVALPSASGLVPDWCAAPDMSGESRLATLAQELSMLLLPETIEATQFKAKLVDDLGVALSRAHVAIAATLVAMDLKSGDKTAQLSLIWPVGAPAELFAATPSTAAVEAAIGAPPKTPTGVPASAPAKQRDLTTLPNYSRSLLKISVPVSVQLAGKKEYVQDVISLAPGSIIKFDKGCDELLQMIVGEHMVAEGEAVKIGEKFGFRVTNMKMPPEHFVPVKKPRRA